MAKNRRAGTTRRAFIERMGVTGAALSLSGATVSVGEEPVIPGFEKEKPDPNAGKGWKPFSDRKIRVGIAGYGLCRFGAQFGFQKHPNVKAKEGQAFIDWILSDEGQQAIAGYQLGGQQLFFPNASN